MHRRYEDACRRIFSCDAPDPTPSHPTWRDVAARAQRYGTVDLLCTLCWEYGQLSTLLNVLQSMPAESGGAWGMAMVCGWLRQQGHWRHLQEYQLSMELYDAAGGLVMDRDSCVICVYMGVCTWACVRE